MSALDRDKARELLAPCLEQATERGWNETLDALANCVTDDPHTIDRNALEMLLDEARYSRGLRWSTYNLATEILVLLRPEPLTGEWFHRALPDPRIAELEQANDALRQAVDTLGAAKDAAEEKLAQIEAFCATAAHGALRWADPLRVPDWVGQVRAILRGVDA